MDRIDQGEDFNLQVPLQNGGGIDIDSSWAGELAIAVHDPDATVTYADDGFTIDYVSQLLSLAEACELHAKLGQVIQFAMLGQHEHQERERLSRLKNNEAAA